MEPIEFLELAEELVERKTPCGCRTSIGRAYYGAFNVAGKLLRDAGLTVPEGPAAHQKNWFDFIKWASAPSPTSLGSIMRKNFSAEVSVDEPDPVPVMLGRKGQSAFDPSLTGAVHSINASRRIYGRVD